MTDMGTDPADKVITKSGRPLTERDLERVANEAQAGFDLSIWRPRHERAGDTGKEKQLMNEPTGQDDPMAARFDEDSKTVIIDPRVLGQMHTLPFALGELDRLARDLLAQGSTTLILTDTPTPDEIGLLHDELAHKINRQVTVLVRAKTVHILLSEDALAYGAPVPRLF